MKRRDFIYYSALAGTGIFAGHKTLANMMLNSEIENIKMPVLFMGHGSPMNAIEDNQFTQGWKNLVKGVPTPKAILVVSAHWETKGTKIVGVEKPKLIYDMYGFPDELYQVKYPAPGAPEMAKSIIEEVKYTTIQEDHDWGLDHGAWSILVHMFPEANIPCFQMSLNYTRDMQWHYELAQQLSYLRKKGVLIVGSGNIVHNLRYMAYMNSKPFDWALEFDAKIESLILDKNHTDIINYKKLGAAAEVAVNSAEHYIPLLYILALQDKDDKITFANHEAKDTLLNSFMRCIKIG